MIARVLPVIGLRTDSFVRFYDVPNALAPGHSDGEEDDFEADWDSQDPADAELDGADVDLDWWLEDEAEEEPPLPDDWQNDDESNDA